MKKKASLTGNTINDLHLEIEERKKAEFIAFLATIIVRLTIKDCHHEESDQVPEVQPYRPKP